jgi:transcriptional regulator NrdR family protein
MRERKTVTQADVDASRGLRCPRCQSTMSFVNWTRKRANEDGSVVRGRDCRGCGYRFVTEEKVIA